MKLLLVSLNFPPELTGIARYNGEMVEWLKVQGHQVRVICAPPYYPNWQVKEGFRADRFSVDSSQGFEITRCPLYVPRRPTGLRRLLHLVSFAVTSLPIILWTSIRWKPDILFLTMPPLACAPATLLAAKITGARAWLHVQDFEVDAAFDLGIVRGQRLKRCIIWIERQLLKRFDRVSTISMRMMTKLQEKEIEPHRSRLFPNWSDFNRIKPLESESAFRSVLGIDPKTCVFLYSGSLGVKQGLDLLIDAFEQLPAELDAALVICGEGPARESIQAQIAENDRIALLPLQPADELNELLGMADVQLMPQRTEVQDLVMPSKLPNMLASGRPVIVCASVGSEIAAVLAGIALIVPPGDVHALSAAMAKLAKSPNDRAEMGALGRARARTLWDRETILQQAFQTSV
jgi:colanic acid biosynthesis glycosyl transferase WcaI